MEIQAKSADRNLLLELSGELDHHGARDALRQVELSIDAALPRMLVLDFSGVTFMDSSGIGLVMGRYRLMQTMEGEVKIVEAPSHIVKVMKLAGMDKLASFEK